MLNAATVQVPGPADVSGASDLRSCGNHRGSTELSELGVPVVEWSGSAEQDVPVVVMLHGWGETEAEMTALVPSLPTGAAYACLRAPYLHGRHCAWFERGRPFNTTAAWFEDWLDSNHAYERPIVLVGFSAGAAFAGGVLLLNPQRYLGAAILSGTLPFDAGVDTPRDRLLGKEILLVHNTADATIPPELLDRAWQYLTEASGARTRALRFEGGHGVSDQAVAGLAHWLDEVVVR
jgi:phospholipase/carboxylesterase